MGLTEARGQGHSPPATGLRHAVPLRAKVEVMCETGRNEANRGLISPVGATASSQRRA